MLERAGQGLGCSQFYVSRERNVSVCGGNAHEISESRGVAAVHSCHIHQDPVNELVGKLSVKHGELSEPCIQDFQCEELMKPNDWGSFQFEKDAWSRGKHQLYVVNVNLQLLSKSIHCCFLMSQVRCCLSLKWIESWWNLHHNVNLSPCLTFFFGFFKVEACGITNS